MLLLAPDEVARLSVDRDAVLGSGSFGLVYSATDANCARLAVKAVDERGLSEKAKQQLHREVELHLSVVHVHVLQCFGAFYSDCCHTLHILLDRAAGDLGTAINDAATLVQVLAPTFLRQLLSALDHLHNEQQIVHGDIKPSNVLLSPEGCVKLCDLGAAARIAGARRGRTTLVGSPAYLAPEVIVIDHLGLEPGGATYSFPSDIWSVGVLMVEMLSGGHLPFPAIARDPTHQAAAVCFRPPTLEPASAFSASARSLVMRLLAKQAYLRPTAEEALGLCAQLVAAAHLNDASSGEKCDAPCAATSVEQEALRECLLCLDRNRSASNCSPCQRASADFEALHLVTSPEPSVSSESPSSAVSWVSSLVDNSPS